MKKDEYFFEYPKLNDIREIVYKTAYENPENTAFIIKNKKNNDVTYTNISYKQFKEEVRSFGTGLYNLGLKGKRVAIISKNRYEWCLSYISVLIGGMIAVPLDRGLTEVEIESSIIRSKADCIIFESSLKETIEKIRSNGNTNLKEYICMDEDEEFKSVDKVRTKGKEILSKGNIEYDNVKIFDNIAEGKKLMKIASSTKGHLHKEFADIIEKVERLYKEIKEDAARLGYGLVLCHNDTYEPNYLIDREREIYLIDWEYAGMNYGANDIGCILCRYNWSEEQVERYLRMYIGHDLDEDERRFYYGFIPISAFYWFCWGLYKGSVGDDDSFFFLPSYRNLIRYLDDALESYGINKKNGDVGD